MFVFGRAFQIPNQNKNKNLNLNSNPEGGTWNRERLCVTLVTVMATVIDVTP